MSWFTSGLDTLSQLSERVQQAIPIDKELLAKLTLNTDEMKAERQQFGDDANRKDEVKDMLAGMLPWETRDSERDILVEECKEAILALSGSEETFYGPYEMPALKVNLEDEKEKKESTGEDNDDEGDDDGGDGEDEDEDAPAKTEHKPSAESLEKLAKLEPLPPLLSEFDLDSHVGLIEKLLKEDPVLEKRQSTLSGKFRGVNYRCPSSFCCRLAHTGSLVGLLVCFFRWWSQRKGILAQLFLPLRVH
jgi:hypothetical protein